MGVSQNRGPLRLVGLLVVSFKSTMQEGLPVSLYRHLAFEATQWHAVLLRRC